MLEVVKIYRVHCPLCSLVKASRNKIEMENFAKTHHCKPDMVYSQKPSCIVGVGHDDSHSPPATWTDRNKTLFYVCDRHKAQYDEREDLGPYDWERI